MAVVRIEVDFNVDPDDGVLSAGTARIELDSPDGDLPQILERAQGAMLRLLPQKTQEAEPQTILQLNNVQFREVNQGILFGPTDGFQVKLTGKGQCQDRCPRDEAGHPPCRCELPLGHGSKHRAPSSGHGWPDADRGGLEAVDCA